MIKVQLKATHPAWGVENEARKYAVVAQPLTPDKLRALARAACVQMFGALSPGPFRLFEVAVSISVIECVQVIDRGVDSSVTFSFLGDLKQLRVVTEARLLELGLSEEEVVRGGAVLLSLSRDRG